MVGYISEEVGFAWPRLILGNTKDDGRFVGYLSVPYRINLTDVSDDTSSCGNLLPSSSLTILSPARPPILMNRQ